MADLIAQGMNSQQRWRRTLPDGQPVVLGRTARSWAVPWDEQISRRHAEVCWRSGRLEVRRLPTARNPLFVRGQALDIFELRPGECFVSGETSFTLTNEQVSLLVDIPAQVEEHAFRAQDLQQVPFRDADRRLEILGRLPEVISGATTDAELFIRLGNMLLAGIAQAEAVAVVAVEPSVQEKKAVNILYWDRRLTLEGGFQPSERLILRAIGGQESVSHVWGRGGNATSQDVTVSENFDWAFCTPVRGESPSTNPLPRGGRGLSEGAGWGLYVAGRFDRAAAGTPPSADPRDLRTDLKFTELVAALLSSLRQVRLLQRQQALLSQFFSPSLLSTLGNEDADQLLAPRETEVSVLFCDLRGFSREADRSAADLMGLLERVSKALGVMTHHILDHGGVIADFQGDAALGFWGWPLAQPDAILRVCMAALGIRTQFGAAALRSGHSLAGFRVGIGIGTGRAVAGKIGTSDQAKVGVFGPVVNLASRLEGMTKLLQTPILLDETTARLARQQVPARLARFRRVVKVKPYGLDTALTVTELLPPLSEYPELGDEHVAYYEAAFDALEAGRWAEAYALLHKIPPEDRVKDFLTVYIAQHNRVAPTGWDGVIPLMRKG
jgi:adenylate cyclase